MVNMSLTGLGLKPINSMACRITLKHFAPYPSRQSEVRAYWWVRVIMRMQFAFS